MESSMIIKPGIDRAIISSFIFLVIIHNFSCLWYIIGNFYYEEGNLNNWIVSNGILFYSPFVKYLYSWYWTIQTIFTVGYGDIGWNNSGELIISIIVMMSGVLIYSLLLKLIENIYSFTKLDKDLYNFIDNYSGIKLNFKLPKNLIKKINKYILNEINFDYKFNIWIKDLDHKLITILQYEILKDKFSYFYFFQNKTDSFISSMISLLKYRYMKTNDIIFNYDDKIKNMYFILKGSVRLYFWDKNKNIFLLEYLSGSYFGEIEYLYSSKYKKDIKRVFKAVCTRDTVWYEFDIINIEELFFKKFLDVGYNFIKHVKNIQSIINRKLKRRNSRNKKTIIKNFNEEKSNEKISNKSILNSEDEENKVENSDIYNNFKKSLNYYKKKKSKNLYTESKINNLNWLKKVELKTSKFDNDLNIFLLKKGYLNFLLSKYLLKTNKNQLKKKNLENLKNYESIVKFESMSDILNIKSTLKNYK